jgi:hypothetical protein
VIPDFSKEHNFYILRTAWHNPEDNINLNTVCITHEHGMFSVVFFFNSFISNQNYSDSIS